MKWLDIVRSKMNLNKDDQKSLFRLLERFVAATEGQTNALRDIAGNLSAVEVDLQLISRSLQQISNDIPAPVVPKALTIKQNGGTMITGVAAGGSGTFQESFIPTNAALPAGASLSVVWTVDDPNVSLAPSDDGTSVVASVSPGDTATSFNLTATGTSAALPAPITGTVNVPILPTPPPLPTALAINQTA